MQDMGIFSRSCALGALVLTSCFSLDRLDGLEPGSVNGVASFGADARAGVVASLANSPRTIRSATDGRFSFKGLPVGNHGLRLIEDENADGIADRGAAVAFAMPAAADGTVGIVDLGSVGLRGTVTVRGTVVDGDGGGLSGVSVVVLRRELDQQAEITATLDNEAVNFGVGGIVQGTFEIMALAAGGRASAAESITVGDDADRDEVFLVVRAAPGGEVTAVLTPAVPQAEFKVVPVGAGPDYAPSEVDLVANIGVRFPVSTFQTVAAGVYDVWFFDGARIIAGLSEQVSLGDGPQVWGPAVVGDCSLDGCLPGGEGEGEATEGEGEPTEGEGEPTEGEGEPSLEPLHVGAFASRGVFAAATTGATTVDFEGLVGTPSYEQNYPAGTGHQATSDIVQAGASFVGSEMYILSSDVDNGTYSLNGDGFAVVLGRGSATVRLPTGVTGFGASMKLAAFSGIGTDGVDVEVVDRSGRRTSVAFNVSASPGFVGVASALEVDNLGNAAAAELLELHFVARRRNAYVVLDDVVFGTTDASAGEGEGEGEGIGEGEGEGEGEGDSCLSTADCATGTCDPLLLRCVEAISLPFTGARDSPHCLSFPLPSATTVTATAETSDCATSLPTTDPNLEFYVDGALVAADDNGLGITCSRIVVAAGPGDAVLCLNHAGAAVTATLNITNGIVGEGEGEPPPFLQEGEMCIEGDPVNVCDPNVPLFCVGAVCQP